MKSKAKRNQNNSLLMTKFKSKRRIPNLRKKLLLTAAKYRTCRRCFAQDLVNILALRTILFNDS